MKMYYATEHSNSCGCRIATIAQQLPTDRAHRRPCAAIPMCRGYAVMVSGGSVTAMCCDNQYAEDRQ
ncbi:hypothetical protein [Sphingobacterium sp. UME9]|uniref:hypothetical protein n=1 Tax=Sphingobacterium sp. UME9 TaxID=1862316 RepID=UPI001C823DB1|nr:hypothetical protein [Sphingobacterium sp. UME9]